MTPKNGYVPASQLVTIQGVQLAPATAAAFNAANAEAGGIMHIALPAGGYRSYAVQADMHVHPSNYNLDPASAVSLAAAGSSSHGLGNRVDVGTGAGRNWAIANLPRFGFVREFGANDPGHFEYMHETWADSISAPAPSDTVKRVAAYLNGQGIGHTTADQDGIPGIRYWTMVQTWGSQHGLYPQPAYKIDGKPGPRTAQIVDQLAALTTPAPTPEPVPPVIITPEPPVVLPPPPTEPQEPPVTTTPPADPTTPALPAEPALRPLTAVELAAYQAGLETGAAQLQTVADANLPTALSGLLAGHPKGRKRAYYAYAALALVLSFSGDVITAGILTSQQVPVFVAGVTLATSILLKIGVALGFVAASNTSSK